MSEQQTSDWRVLTIVSDASIAAVWAAVILMVLVLVSYAAFVAMPVAILGMVAPLPGVSTGVMALLYVAALTLVKLMALGFVGIAFGLWMWKQRLLRRLLAAQTSAVAGSGE